VWLRSRTAHIYTHTHKHTFTCTRYTGHRRGSWLRARHVQPGAGKTVINCINSIRPRSFLFISLLTLVVLTSPISLALCSNRLALIVWSLYTHLNLVSTFFRARARPHSAWSLTASACYWVLPCVQSHEAKAPGAVGKRVAMILGTVCTHIYYSLCCLCVST
jgi:hypothetical protein